MSSVSASRALSTSVRMNVVLPDMLEPVSSNPVPSSSSVLGTQSPMSGCTTSSARRYFPSVNSGRQVGRFAAQACRRNRGVGLSDEPEQSVDGVAARYDAAYEAVEENHLDVEGRLQQFEHQPYGRGQFVGAVALRATTRLRRSTSET